MISVIVPTNRIGGLDVLLHSLERQTERDFELILVDAILTKRVRANIHESEGHRLFHGGTDEVRLSWVEPHGYDQASRSKKNPFPSIAYCRTMNTGVVHARGDTLLYLCDYSWLHPRCLELHAELQKKHRGPVTCDYRYVTMPALKGSSPHGSGHTYANALAEKWTIPNYRETEPGTEANAAAYTAAVNANADRYVADLNSGKLDPFMWSIFAEPLDEAKVNALPVEHEHKPSGADLANDWNWCSFKNESFPTELVLEMNGHDETYDQSHAWQDSEFSYRLRHRGIRWHAGPPGHTVSVVNPRPWSNIKKLAKPLFYNRELCFGSRRAELGLPVNPEFSLREWRERTIR